jgi:hypothetical protein
VLQYEAKAGGIDRTFEANAGFAEFYMDGVAV